MRSSRSIALIRAAAPDRSTASRRIVREALRLLAERDRLREAHLEKLRGALAEGLAQADRGELLAGPEVVAELRGSLRRRKKSDKQGG